MSSTDLIIYGMSLGMVLIGIGVIRYSRRDRGMGAIAIALGLIGMVAYLTAEEGAPPSRMASPVSIERGTPADASPAP